MGLKSQIAADLLSAMKSRDEVKLSVLRMLKAEFQKAQADKGRSVDLPEEELQTLLRRLIKQRKEAAEQYRTCGADERADAELNEAKVLEEYLPAQLNEDELNSLIETAAKKSGAATPKDIGFLMKELMPLVAGRADGKHVKKKAEAFLAE